MIRLPPSSICLGPGDLQDFERRQKHHEEVQTKVNLQDRLAQPETSTRDGAGVGSSESNLMHCNVPDKHDRDLAAQQTDGLLSDPISENTGNRPCTPTSEASDIASESDAYSPRESAPSPENMAIAIQQPSSPSKDDFHYGGFLESSSASRISVHSSPFDDVSTPPQLQIPGLRPRILPRSPLFLSYNTSSSPEQRITSSLSPRVASRVASHHSPGILFSQPARRSSRFRHQANSFSFDESERASAVYEQDRIVSSSTTNSKVLPSNELNLHEELLGSSLQSSIAHSSGSSEILEYDEITPHYELAIRPRESGGRESIFSSPLPVLPESLPPPFSSTSRSASGAASLPSVDRDRESSRASPAASPSISPRRVNPQRNRRGLAKELVLMEPVLSNSPVGGSPSPTRVLRSATRLLSLYGARSPIIQCTSPQPRSVSSPSKSQPSSPRETEESLEQSPERTSSRNYRVYDDSVASASQPQTPAHLPEARHRSRFHPSYIAPAHASAINTVVRSHQHVDRAIGDRSPVRRDRGTPTQRGLSRPDSPVGLTEYGFHGLFGGRENGNEEQNWIDGVRSTDVGVRLSGIRDARSDGRNLRNTPEREDWRIGRN